MSTLVGKEKEGAYADELPRAIRGDCYGIIRICLIFSSSTWWNEQNIPAIQTKELLPIDHLAYSASSESSIE
jgi:hypothetical protein